MITRATVTAWTTDRGTIQVYEPVAGWRFRSLDDRAAFNALFSDAFGLSLHLERRGSPRARRIALIIAAAGVISFVIALATNTPILTIVGTPLALFGAATFAALCQKVSARSR